MLELVCQDFRQRLFGPLISLPQPALDPVGQAENAAVQGEGLSLFESVAGQAGQSDQQGGDDHRGRWKQDVPSKISEIGLLYHGATVL